MSITEKRLESAETQAKAMRDNKWKGVRMRPKTNNILAVLPSACRQADKHGVTFYVVAVHSGGFQGMSWVVSCKDDAKATYELQGGFKVTADLEIYKGEVKI